MRKRYRTLEMDEVALVLLVHERPGMSADGTRPGPFRRLAQPADVPADSHVRRRVWVDVRGAHEHGQRAGLGRARSRCR